MKDRIIRDILKETDFTFDMSCEHCKDNRKRLVYFIRQFEALTKFLKGES